MRRLAPHLLAALLAFPLAAAADDTLLIQIQPDARYRLWYANGPRHLADEELVRLAALATADGQAVATEAGPARVFDVPHAAMLVFADGQPDERLLVDRDACGGMRVWHSAGKTDLTEDELTDLVTSALPDGGKRISVGGRYAKAFQTLLGTVAVIWRTAR